MIDLFYRRPTRVSSEEVNLWPANINADEMRGSKNPDGIPSGLSFDRIIDGRTCYPCRLRDFMFYLRFVEFSAENLRFFLWYRSYCERFETLSPEEKALSPPFVPDSGSRRRGDWMLEADDKNPPNTSTLGGVNLKQLSSGNSEEEDVDGATLAKESVYPSKVLSVADTVTETASTLRGESGVDNGPEVKDQPFRSEVSRVASLFLYPSSPLELNLSSRDRHLTLRAINATTHPSALMPALLTAERFLRWQSHPNFIRRQVSNANKERGTLMVILFVFSTIFMLASAVPLVLSDKGRGWRVFPASMGALAFICIFCRQRNFCWAYYSRGGRRSTEPWDAVGGWEVTKGTKSQAEERTRRNSDDIEADAAGIDVNADDKDGNTLAAHVVRTNSSASRSSAKTQVHDFEFPDERLAAENVRIFEGRSLAGKGFEIGVRVKDKSLQMIQLGIYLQMWLIYLVALGVFCAILMPIPKVGLIK